MWRKRAGGRHDEPKSRAPPPPLLPLLVRDKQRQGQGMLSASWLLNPCAPAAVPHPPSWTRQRTHLAPHATPCTHPRPWPCRWPAPCAAAASPAPWCCPCPQTRRLGSCGRGRVGANGCCAWCTISTLSHKLHSVCGSHVCMRGFACVCVNMRTHKSPLTPPLPIPRQPCSACACVLVRKPPAHAAPVVQVLRRGTRRWTPAAEVWCAGCMCSGWLWMRGWARRRWWSDVVMGAHAQPTPRQQHACLPNHSALTTTLQQIWACSPPARVPRPPSVTPLHLCSPHQHIGPGPAAGGGLEAPRP